MSTRTKKTTSKKKRAKREVAAPVSTDAPVEEKDVASDATEDEGPDEPKFEIPTVVERGVVRKCLTEVDLLKLELTHVTLAENLQRQRALVLEAEKEEAEAIRKVRALRHQAAQLDERQHQLNAEKNSLLNDLGEKYDVDFRNPDLTYNTDTRIISEPVKPFKREEQPPPEGGNEQ